jgi:hypothetical protein
MDDAGAWPRAVAERFRHLAECFCHLGVLSDGLAE